MLRSPVLGLLALLLVFSYVGHVHADTSEKTATCALCATHRTALSGAPSHPLLTRPAPHATVIAIASEAAPTLGMTALAVAPKTSPPR